MYYFEIRFDFSFSLSHLFIYCFRALSKHFSCLNIYMYLCVEREREREENLFYL